MNLKQKDNNCQELHNIRFHVSNLCNLNCTYCHVFNKESNKDCKPSLMQYSIIKSALEFYANLNQKQPNHLFKFSFYGGEPLFNWKTIKKAVALGNKIIPGKIEWILNTNATLITKDKAQTLCKEGVDVHVSIDGADEKTNKNRKYKRGKPVLGKVINVIKLLKNSSCRVQFDSCLTGANIDQLKSLINLASKNSVDRIYLALTDESGKQNSYDYNTDIIADKLVSALEYAKEKQIALGGPWKCFFPWFLPESDMKTKHHQHLIVDTDGSLFIPSFPEIKFGRVSASGVTKDSKAYSKVLKKRADLINTCKGCDIEKVCSGYLKEMVKYHTGSLEGHATECEVAKKTFYKYSRHITENQCNKSCTNPSNIDITESVDSYILSKHLVIQPHGRLCKIVHSLSGSAIQASEDMLEFVSLFKSPKVPADVLNNYNISDINNIIQRLVQNRVLLDSSQDEELEYLEEKISDLNKGRIETSNIICFYPENRSESAGKFADFIERLYLNLSIRIQPLRQKILICICKNKNEIARFWYEPELPNWIKAFVAARRILVADINKIQDLTGRSAMPGMSHEILHILLGDYNVKLPIWLEEGFCEHFSKSDPDEKLLELIRKKKLLPLNELESRAKHTLLDIDNARTNENICYKQSHSFVSFLCNILGERTVLNCIKNMTLQKDFHQVFYENSNKTINDMEKQWLKKILN